MDYSIAELGDLPLQSGEYLPRARLAYKTYGRLNHDRSNVIVYPTSFAARHTDIEWLIGFGEALDPDRYFIVIPNMFGNGLSSSPSFTDVEAGRFPHITIHDNVAAQHRLLTEWLGVRRIALAIGFSMGAQQAFEWGAAYPGMVERIAAICGSARTSRHNFVFLEGVKAALAGDPAWRGDAFSARPTYGLRAMGRVYAGWGLSQAFYREEVYLRLGFSSLEDFIVRDWEQKFAAIDGNDLMTMITTWQHADISANPRYKGDLAKALAAITCRALIMPSETDLYFQAEDSRAEAALMPRAQLRPISTIWGHRVNQPRQNPADAMFVDRALAELLVS